MTVMIREQQDGLAHASDLLIHASKSLSGEVFAFIYEVKDLKKHNETRVGGAFGALGNSLKNSRITISSSKIKEIEEYIGCDLNDLNGMRKRGIYPICSYKVKAEIFKSYPVEHRSLFGL